MKPDSPEELARLLAERTARMQIDPRLAADVLARVRRHAEVERPAFVVLALAASLLVWLSFAEERRMQAAGSEADDDVVLAFDGEEGVL